MRVGPTEAEGGQGSSATPVERHVLALEDLGTKRKGWDFHGFSWGFHGDFHGDFHGIFMGFSWDFNGIFMGF